MDQSPGGFSVEGEVGSPDAASRVTHAGLLVALAAVLAIAGLFFLSKAGLCPVENLCAPLPADDIDQGRLDTALPAPRIGLRIEQSFVPRRNGLSEVELLLVRYGGEMAAGEDTGRFSLELIDDGGGRVAEEIVPTAGLSHNQTYTLRFPPQPDSAGRRYVLRLSGNDTNHISAWGYSLDVYDAGELRLSAGGPGDPAPETAARELRFVVRYALTAGDTVRAAVAPLRQGWLLPALLLFLPLPGALLLLWVRPRGWDVAVWLGAALALGVAAWPILWQWVSMLGGRWSGPVLWGVVGGGWAAVAFVVWRQSRMDRRPPTAGRAVTPDEPHVARSETPVNRLFPVGGPRSAVVSYVLLAALLLLTLASRFVAVRDQVFPPWVDSSRHALITAVMGASGRVPTDYEPYLPVDHFPYHFGFHTLSTSLLLMTGRPMPDLLLVVMQMLGGLLPLAVYAAGWMVARRRVVGLLAAFLVALPFFFPGYYATWGRMTQLAAMVVMPVLLALTWRLGRGWPRVWPLVGVLAAGLFLIHFRVFLFYLPFATLAAVAHLVGHRRGWGMVKAAALGLGLALPHAVALWRNTNPQAAFGQSLPGYNDFPLGYLTTGWERVYLVAGGVAVVAVVLGVILRRRWAAFPLLLVLWTGLLFALLAGERLGLPETLVVNLNSMYITLFLPLALLIAIVAAQLWAEIDRRAPEPWRAGAAVAAGVAVGLLLWFGWRQQTNILNRQTILAMPEDVPALAWAAANLPPDARVAVSAWQWLGVTWAAADGGAWLVPLTGLEATTPPIDHIYNPQLFADVRAFNEAASAVEDWGAPASAAWLVDEGVTHIFVGRRGGYFDPAELSRNAGLELLYGQDGVFIFAVR